MATPQRVVSRGRQITAPPITRLARFAHGDGSVEFPMRGPERLALALAVDRGCLRDANEDWCKSSDYQGQAYFDGSDKRKYPLFVHSMIG